MSTKLRTVLFGFWDNLASYLERSTLNPSYSYAAAVDRPICAPKEVPFGGFAHCPKIQFLASNAG
jgi:hypothetical protein